MRRTCACTTPLTCGESHHITIRLPATFGAVNLSAARPRARPPRHVHARAQRAVPLSIRPAHAKDTTNWHCGAHHGRPTSQGAVGGHWGCIARPLRAGEAARTSAVSPLRRSSGFLSGQSIPRTHGSPQAARCGIWVCGAILGHQSGRRDKRQCTAAVAPRCVTTGSDVRSVLMRLATRATGNFWPADRPAGVAIDRA